MSGDYSPFTSLQTKTNPVNKGASAAFIPNLISQKSLTVSPEEPSSQELLGELEVPQSEAVKGRPGPPLMGPPWSR